MNYKRLEEFIHHQMKMTHIYQPVMLKTLLESKRHSATAKEIAQSFLGYDIAKLTYYTNIVKRWPHDTLVRKRKIVSYDKKTKHYKLSLDMTEEQRKKLIELCDLRLQEFIDNDPWIRRMHELDQKSMSGSVRYDIISRSKGMCAGCGIKPTDGLGLDIDHIIPWSLGGKTEPSNLQALCPTCNRGKSNNDDIDFMLEYKRMQFRKKGCSMCHPKKTILQNTLAHAVLKKNADIPLHALIRPNRHIDSFTDMIPAEKNLCILLADELMENIKSQDASIRKFDLLFDEPSSHYAINVVPVR